MITMNKIDYYTPEETILTPHETTISIEVWLDDCKYIDKKNYEGMYSFSFSPLTMEDYLRLEEHIEQAVMTVEFGKSQMSRKEPEASCKTKKGSFYTSQFFLPKVNVEYHYPEMLNGSEASIKLHLRDSADGTIYLQGEWVDLYEPVISQVKEKALISHEITPLTDDDW